MHSWCGQVDSVVVGSRVTCAHKDKKVQHTFIQVCSAHINLSGNLKRYHGHMHAHIIQFARVHGFTKYLLINPKAMSLVHRV